MKARSLFMQHVREHRLHYVLGAALLSISCLLQLVIPELLRRFTDDLEGGVLQARTAWSIAGLIVIFSLGVALFRSVSRMYIFGLSRKLDRNTKRRLFQHWERLSPEYYSKQRIGDLMSHAVNDVNIIREVGMMGVFNTIEAVVLISVTVVAMVLMVDPWLTLCVMLPLPALTYLGYRFRSQIQERATVVQEAISQLTSRLQEYISGIRVIKTYVQEKPEQEKFRIDNQGNMDAQRRLIYSNSKFVSISQGIVGLSFLISIVFGGMLVIDNAITLGQFVAFNTYLAFVITPIENLGKVINILQRGKAADVRLQKVLNTKPAIKNHPRPVKLSQIEGTITFNHLDFTYPDSHRPALKDVHLHVPKGSSLAIVGRIGSGKTTLVNLLLRLYDAPTGSLLIDGQPIDRIDLKLLRDSIGYVPQEFFLFSTSISDNIAFSPRTYGEDEIYQAAKVAQVHDNIIHFPQKFETKLGERGISLSGGQRQRISMARALIKKPSILIFDDSLSAVDAQTEERILHGLREVMQGRTTIIVSHRISAIRDADQIIVLDHGQVAEHGNHESLLESGGIYANMYYQQQLNREMGG